MNNEFNQAEVKLGLTVTQMATALCVPYRTYYKWSTGEREAPAAAYSALAMLLFLHEKGLLDLWLSSIEQDKK